MANLLERGIVSCLIFQNIHAHLDTFYLTLNGGVKLQNCIHIGQRRILPGSDKHTIAENIIGSKLIDLKTERNVSDQLDLQTLRSLIVPLCRCWYLLIHFDLEFLLAFELTIFKCRL